LIDANLRRLVKQCFFLLSLAVPLVDTVQLPSILFLAVEVGNDGDADWQAATEVQYISFLCQESILVITKGEVLRVVICSLFHEFASGLSSQGSSALF